MVMVPTAERTGSKAPGVNDHGVGVRRKHANDTRGETEERWREGEKDGKEGGRSAEDARVGGRGTEPEPESPARKLLAVKTESRKIV